MHQDKCLHGIHTGGVRSVDQRDDKDRDTEDADRVAEYLGLREEEVVCEPHSQDLRIDTDPDSDTIDVVVALEATY